MTVKKIKKDLENKFNKVPDTPKGFNFFVAIHNFVEHIESNPQFFNTSLRRLKLEEKAAMLKKYKQLRKIHRAFKDINTKTNRDLGHERYMAILDLNKIKDDNLSDTNPFWKKRGLYRKITSEVYKELSCAGCQ